MQMDQRCCHSQGRSLGDHAPAASDTTRADAVRRQLRRILASEQFRYSLRLTRFLYFVVEMMLAGNSASIKAYTIAVDALGRGTGFDPQRDPIVRVEAARLRQALARYYAEAGRDDALIIDLPRGTYVPVVRAAATQPSVPAPPRGGNVAKAWWELLATQRQCLLLYERLTCELSQQILSVRRTLEESKALLRQDTGIVIAGRAAPPMPRAALAGAAEGTAAADVPGECVAFQPQSAGFLDVE
jgi:hypothetical protein